MYAEGRGAALVPEAPIVPVGNAAFCVDAVDAAGLPQDRLEALLSSAKDLKWVQCRSLLGKGEPGEVEAVARAVSLLAWHKENAFSGFNGKPTTSAANGQRRKQPPSAGGRTMYPRVDPVAIVLVESADGQRCLLGRQRNYPPGMFTCVSGFIEHGESAENAAVREVLEETGVRCASSSLVASQPWPLGRGFHCELMLGCVAKALEGGEVIDVSREQGGGGELEAAKWFDRAEVLEMIKRVGPDDGSWVPPNFAVAHHLIRRWAENLLPIARF